MLDPAYMFLSHTDTGEDVKLACYVKSLYSNDLANAMKIMTKSQTVFHSGHFALVVTLSG